MLVMRADDRGNGLDLAVLGSQSGKILDVNLLATINHRSIRQFQDQRLSPPRTMAANPHVDLESGLAVEKIQRPSAAVVHERNQRGPTWWGKCRPIARLFISKIGMPVVFAREKKFTAVLISPCARTCQFRLPHFTKRLPSRHVLRQRLLRVHTYCPTPHSKLSRLRYGLVGVEEETPASSISYAYHRSPASFRK